MSTKTREELLAEAEAIRSALQAEAAANGLESAEFSRLLVLQSVLFHQIAELDAA